MHVEECCFALLNHILPEVDSDRSGLTIDIGVGTFAFYCLLFKQLGFTSIAVEPVPNDELKQICDREGIKLWESCITETDGMVSIYMGTWKGSENTNLCSTRSDWWGIENKSKQVMSMTLPTLLKQEIVNKITCIKIDIEGTEIDVINQLLDIPDILLPLVLMFEYGGGDLKSSKKGGWTPDIYSSTLKCLEILRTLDYKEIILIDSAPDFSTKVYDLSSLHSFDEIFPEYANYGNIIASRDRILSQLDLNRITSKFISTNPSNASTQSNIDVNTNINKNILTRVLNKIKQYFS